jgi:release factor glutamine methyltransferase
MRVGSRCADFDRATGIGDLVLEAEGRLRSANVTDTPRLEAEVLLAAVLDTNRTRLIASYADRLNNEQRREYFSTISRRISGEPVAYITGTKEFMGLAFDIDPRALIPRPETETLVEHVISMILEGSCMSDRILEIGTGCGCIAIALARELPHASVYATDISRDAVQLAVQNARRFGLSERITFLEGDVFRALPKTLMQTFDIIVSNPPYISDAAYSGLESGIRDFEPALALKGGRDGLDIIRNIASGAPDFLKVDGILAIEIGETQLRSATALLESMRSLSVTEIVRDLSDRPRVITSRNRGIGK